MPNAMQYKKEQYHVGRAKGTTWYKVYPSLTQVETTVPASVLLQQFTHLVCTPIALASNESHPCLSYLIWGIEDKTERYERENTRDIRTNGSTAKSVWTESNVSSVTLWGRIACFVQSRPSLVVAGQSAVLESPCERRRVLKYR